MKIEGFILQGKHVRLEPLGRRHVEGLAAASAEDPALYQWSPVPRSAAEATKYVETALAWQEAGTAAPFAVIRVADDMIIGSTRFWQIERWPWPQGHPLHNRPTPDACEIGHTWFARSAIRTAANTESKFLMLLARAVESAVRRLPERMAGAEPRFLSLRKKGSARNDKID
jgi:N-acetyltransferase